MNVFDLFAKITLDKSDYENGLNDASEKSSSFGKKIASGLKVAGKATAVATGTAITAVSALTKKAVEGYADYEQLVGGVETLFKSSASKVQEYANNAYKTAGLSANQYMETVTSFSASLLQSLDGDTAKSADVADMAIRDMADNANKMGTSMESIQTAYQGFAKQNYTMLDNLKLGYGGTKSEMERLLEDATKLSGVKYDIESLNDVYQAIHVIQDELGITGTTAKEASATISGSIAMMQTSWQNLIVGVADENANFDQLVNNFVDSVGTVAENILPRVEQALEGVTKLIDKLAPVIIKKLPELVSKILPKLLEASMSIIQALVGIAPELISMLVNTIIDNLPMLINASFEMINTLVQGMIDSLPILLPRVSEIILLFVDALIANLPTLIIGIVSLVEGIVGALPDIIVVLLNALPGIIENVIVALMGCLPQLIAGCVQLIVGLASHLPEIVLALITAIPQIIVDVVQAIVDCIPMFIDAGHQIVTGLWNGIKDSWTVLVNNVVGLGKNLIKNVQKVFQIGSPSKVFAQIGDYCVQGFDNGIADLGDMSGVNEQIRSGLDSLDTTISANVSSAKSEDSDTGVMVNVTLAGDADGLFKVIRQESNKYYRATGRGAFAY